MRFIERVDAHPQHCLAIPHLGQAHKDGYVDFNTSFNGPGIAGTAPLRIVLSVAAIRDAARNVPQLGLVDANEYSLVCAERAAIQKELEDVQAELAECNRELDAIATLRGRGYSQEKRRGRPPLKAA